jgi:prephenate dehydrogenase
MKPTICIIGGKGKMGKAFAALFGANRAHDLLAERHVGRPFRVLVVDTDTPLSVAEALPKADIVMISVPISVTVEVIEKIAPLMKVGAMICDLTSIKGPAVKAMTEHAPKGVEVLGLHPLCGPKGIEEMVDQVVAVCEVRGGKWSNWMKQFLTEQGAKLEMTTAEDHDRVMAVVQGMTHVSSIAGGMALKALNVNMDETLGFSSPIYALRFGMIGRILSQDSRLYAEIAIENPASLEALKAYKKSVDTLIEAVEHKNVNAFRESFDTAAEFLAGFTEKAKADTDELISYMSKHT